MRIITIDFETSWSATHTLSKMSPIEYVMHPATEIQFVAIKINNEPTNVYMGDEIRPALNAIDWSDAMVIGHNLSGFDSMILAWRYGIKPLMWGCTLSMARPFHAKDVGLSLGALVKHYGIGEKDNTALINTKGRYLKDFTEQEIADMRVYNKDDVEQCYALFKILGKKTPKRELKLIDMTIRMLTEPRFEADMPLLEKSLAEEIERKKLMLLDIATMIGVYQSGMTDEEAAEAARKELASAPKFGEILKSCGVETPMKPSPSNPDKQVPALAKTDEAFIALQEHDDPIVAMAAAARLGVKSTLLETRLGKFIQAAKLCDGRIPVPLRYYGADTTGRWSGEQYNPQNLPRIGGKPKPSDALRYSLKAPKGYKVVVADLSGIELRVNMFLWNVPYAMELFKNDPEKADLYKYFAAHDLFNIEEDEVNKDQRQLGKVCLSEETLVLCLHVSKLLWVKIKDVKPEYQLWDGEEWVWAKGAVSNGWKRTQELCGVSLTPDHLVLSGTEWLQAKDVVGEKVRLALETGAENLSLLALLQSIGQASLHTSLSAIAGFLSIRLSQTISGRLKLLGATLAQKRQQVENATTSILALCLKMTTAQDTWIDYQRPLQDATILKTVTTTTTEVGASTYVNSGDMTEHRFSSTSERLKVGMFRSMKQIALIRIRAMSRVILDSCLGKRICSIREKFRKCSDASKNLSKSSHVYDILDCGPRNRFTILTNKGPMIVHNCHLGLGFGAGGVTFKTVAKRMGGIELTPEESKSTVNKYRSAHPEIVAGWKRCQAALMDMYMGVENPIDPWGLCSTVQDGIKTPYGMIRYPGLHQETKDGKTEWWYGTGRSRARIYGPKVVENIVQHLAREVVSDNMLEIQRLTKQRPVLTIHDELCYVDKEARAPALLKVVQKVMRTPPVFWPQLVTWSEGDIAENYGLAK